MAIDAGSLGSRSATTAPHAADSATATITGQSGANGRGEVVGIARGLRNRAIVAELRLSEHTVTFHVCDLLEKLDVSSRGEAAALVCVNQG
ncbi:helix-turn-helix domain-containing protein [Catenuloplanes nepalensis]|uniref:helix-turn-helix domain-containing protein n=1 Tax=Catenuloplanes nepalensis TaxID=587533 RepID=UPI0027D9094F|nr:helix-turn-helix transcriptional regulator [Catenuloplanes nepalensis]